MPKGFTLAFQCTIWEDTYHNLCVFALINYQQHGGAAEIAGTNDFSDDHSYEKVDSTAKRKVITH